MSGLTVRIVWWVSGLFAALVPLLVLLLCVRRKVRTNEPRCATCGYIVRGLPSKVCPECGSNLRGRGTLRRGERRPIGRWPRLIAWSVLLLVVWRLLDGPLGSIPNRLFWPVVPKHRTQFVHFDVGPNAWIGEGRDKHRQVVQVVVVCDGMTATPPPVEVLVIPRTLKYGYISTPPRREGLHISLADLHCDELDSLGRRAGMAGPLTTDRLRDFLHAHHLPETDDHVANVMRIVKGSTSNAATWGMAVGRPAGAPDDAILISSHGSGSMGGSLVSIDHIVNGSVLAAWLLGLVVIVLMSPRRRAVAQTATAC